MKMDQYNMNIGNFMQRQQESLPEAWEKLQEMIISYPHHGITQ